MASKEAWRNRIVGHGDEDPTQLLANPKNWRIHPSHQQQALTGALDQVGWVQQVIVNQTTGHMVDGHLRVELAISRGEPSVPVVYVDLTAEEEALVLASLDPIGAMAATDDEKLRMLMAEVAFDSQALEDAIAKVAGESTKREGLTDPDDVPEPSEAPWVKPGDLFALGDHRLLCGDSTDAADVGRLVDGEQVAVTFTDPPYGIAYQAMRGGKAIASDDSAAEALRVTAAALRNVKSNVIFACCDWRSLRTMQDAFAAAAVEPKACIVWDKEVRVQNLDRYAKQHELVLYAGPYGGQPTLATDVWRFRRDFDPDHPTPKPVELVAFAIETSSAPGDAVFDPFAGSGTTLIAAEKTGRRGLAVELDPKYVQVSVERWEAFTGRKAEKIP